MRQQVLQATESACLSGCGSNETTSHLFLECDVFASLWYHVWQWLRISSVSSGDIRHHLQQFTTMSGFPRLTHPFFRIIWFATVWAIWKERNNRVFQNKVSVPSVVVEKVKLISFLWLKSNKANFSYRFHDWWKHPLLCMGIHA